MMNFVLHPDRILSYNLYLKHNRYRKYITPNGLIYKKYISEEVQKIMNENNWMIRSDKLKLDIQYKFKQRRRIDLDNLDKSFFDCLNGVLFNDDSQIFQRNAIKILGNPINEIILKVEIFNPE